MRNYLFIINPIAGASHDRINIKDAINYYSDVAGVNISVAETKCAGHASELAKQAVKESVDVVVAVGGDGTVNEIASQLVGTSTCLGIIPCGSGNGLARHLTIPLSPIKAIEALLLGKSITIDTATINGIPFFCTAGVGYDAKVSLEYTNSGKRGLVTYANKAAESWFSYQPQDYSLIIDGRSIDVKAALITVANANQWGNDFHVAPHASLSDGLLNITIVKSLRSIHILEMPRQILSYSFDKNADVQTYTGATIEITQKNSTLIHFDGEPRQLSSELIINIKPQSLNVIVPLAFKDQH